MNGHKFEYKCARMLRRKGFHHVVVTKKSGDQGVDIIAYKHFSKYAVQCKYYSYPVGNKAVQEVYAGGKCYTSLILNMSNEWGPLHRYDKWHFHQGSYQRSQ